MMPFVMGDPNSVPPEYQQYWPLVQACGIEASEMGKVGYLSITESEVEPGKTQRRPGIHVEGHPEGSWGGGWGRGGDGKQGLYMGSNQRFSCRAWGVHVEEPGPMGDCEHLREALRIGVVETLFAPNWIYWMTDRTPHESLPTLERSYRQWFRVVTSPVSMWFAAHSTPNRLGIVAPATIITGDKFAAAAQEQT
jgi:hypothetical protein